MMQKIRAVLKSSLANSKGGVTVEASIVLPGILLMLFGMVFFSMYVYHKLVMLDTAVYTATQRAETWDNTGKNMEDGYQRTIKSDGLYWRLLADFSGYAGEEEGAGLSTGGPQLVREKSTTALGLVKDMLKYEVFKPRRTKVAVHYNNLLLRRTVSVSIHEQLMLPVNWMANLLKPDLLYRAEADIVEPVEFIRNLGLVEKYTPQILSSLNNIPDIFRNDQSETGQSRKLIASKGIQYGQRVRVFHYQGCRYISRIKADNLIEFDSPEQANANGYYLCWECAKRKIR